MGRFSVPVSHHGLAQPVCGSLAAVQHPRRRFLLRSLERGAWQGKARGLQHRPELVLTSPKREQVHQRSLHWTAGAARSQVQLGLERAVLRQYLRGKAVAYGEVRGGLTEGLHKRTRGQDPDRQLLPILQHSEASSGPGLPDTDRGVQRRFGGIGRRCKREEVVPRQRVGRVCRDSGTLT